MIGRPPRAGKTTKRRSFRTTDAEWSRWKRAARSEGCATLSAWAVQTLNARAEGVAVDRVATDCQGNVVVHTRASIEAWADAVARDLGVDRKAAFKMLDRGQLRGTIAEMQLAPLRFLLDCRKSDR
jgi:hypothetical protein